MIKNNYLSYIEVEGHDLFAVEMADGIGSTLTPQDEIELAGWHLPVRFKTGEQAQESIKSGPHTMFDIVIDSVWSKHAISCGATPESNYSM